MKTVCACVTGLALSASAFADVVSTVSIADNTLYQDATGGSSRTARLPGFGRARSGFKSVFSAYWPV